MTAFRKSNQDDEEGHNRRNGSYQVWGKLVKDTIIGSIGTQRDGVNQDVGKGKKNRDACKHTPEVFQKGQKFLEFPKVAIIGVRMVHTDARFAQVW